MATSVDRDTLSARSAGYVQRVGHFLDTVLTHGRDTYGEKRTPLFADGLHAESLQPFVWKHEGEEWILSNFAGQQSLLRVLDGLAGLTGESRYRDIAIETTRHVLDNLRSRNGLLHWGGHAAWDLLANRPVSGIRGQGHVHELEAQQAYYELLWQVNPESTRELLGAIWGAHILDWSTLDHNRHGHSRDAETLIRPQWEHPFQQDVELPLVAHRGNLSFAMVTPPLLRAGTALSVLGGDEDALVWSRRLAYRWQQNRHPETGLSGGQISNLPKDRVQEALGHVYPNICEARIVAGYQRAGRYHHIPLAQLQAAENLSAAGGRRAEVAHEFVKWASEDIKVYFGQCYDPERGAFLAKMTDGTEIDGSDSRAEYWSANRFGPVKPAASGFLIWAYALAYRLTRDEELWRMLRELMIQAGLGDIGASEGAGRKLDELTALSQWKFIYILLELHQSTGDAAFLRQACRVAENILSTQSSTGLFPRPGFAYARCGDPVPLAILHLAGVLQERGSALPQAVVDCGYFHATFDGKGRIYDGPSFYGDPFWAEG